MIKVKKILLGFVLLLLMLPLLQNRLHIFKVKPLDGDFVMLEKPEFSKAGWFNGEFQGQFNDWLEQNIGLRNVMVRINNQIDFSLFGEVHAEGVIRGKKDILYEYDYIRAFLGWDFIGETTLDKKMRRLKQMQDFLKNEKNIDLIFVLEPSKARYEPEYLPKPYDSEERTITNYECILKMAEKYDITYLDVNNYFLRMKDTTQFLLYPQYGVHWSVYGVTLVIDTLIRFIEGQAHLDLPEMYIDDIEISKRLRDTDYDAGKPLNLLFKLPTVPMAYPVIRFEENPKKDRPNVLAVADSYYWNIFNTRLPQHLFNNEAFWYFNSLVYPDFYYGAVYVEDLDLKTEIEQQNIILLMVTERFQFKYDWRFIDNIYELYNPDFEQDYHYNYENDIRMNIGLFDKLAEDAKTSDLTLEEIIHREADFLFITENLPKYLETYGPQYYIDVIRKDSTWFQSVTEKAINKNIPVEEMLIIDADYMFKNEYPEIFEKYYAIKSIEYAIRNDSAWHRTIEQKAKRKYLTSDEMIHQDAVWIYNNQSD